MNKKVVGKIIFLVLFGMVALTSRVQAVDLTVTVVDVLDFGLLAPGINGGTVSFPANGTISGTGDVILLGGAQKGLVTIQANNGDAIQIKVKKDRLTGPNAQMDFEGSCIGPGGVLGIGQCAFVATGGVDSISIGAVLTVGPNATQTGGNYSGTSLVTGTSQ